MYAEELEGQWGPPPIGGGLPIPVEEVIGNIRINCKLDLLNLNIETEHDRIMVMVCGGPTAKGFLEEIREKGIDGKHDIFCSNKTHDWLIENGIVPDYMFIIDPRKSKVDDVQHPHKDVHYMIGAQCNPGVFKALEGYKVTRILTYCNVKFEGISDIQIIDAFFSKKTFVPLEGGTMAGLRAMTLANIMGYKQVEFYGFDSCFFEKDKDNNPVYYSYDKERRENELEVETSDGKTYKTSPVFASQARQFIKWKHRLAWIDFIIHGDSLTSRINVLENEKLRPKHKFLISDYMLKMNHELHKSKEEYGTSAHVHAGKICLLIGQLMKRNGCRLTMLDYGCGKGVLEKVMPPITGLRITGYDPCIDGLDKKPRPSDVVVCTDVLEHVEPECLSNVLDELKRLTRKVCYVSVCTREADKHYSDGQNTHLIQEDYKWWYPQLRKRFHVVESQMLAGKAGEVDHFTCVLQAREVL